MRVVLISVTITLEIVVGDCLDFSDVEDVIHLRDGEQIDWVVRKD